MTSTNRFLLVAASAMCFATLPVTAQSDRDSISRTDGKSVTRVKIIKLDRDKITYSKNGKETEIQVSRVADFRWGDAPEPYTRGTAAAERGSHAAGAKLFVEAQAAAKRDVVKQAAAFFAGRSFAMASLKDPVHANNAVTKLQEYLQAAPNGYFMPEAKVRMAQATLAGGDASGAEKMLADLDAESTTNAWPLYWTALIKFTRGRAQHADGKFSDARFSYQGVDAAVAAAIGQDAKHNSELNRIRTEAFVLQGETFIGEKLYDDALSYYQTLASNNTRGVKAAAQAGQGQILFIQGAAKNDAERLRQAQIALARASIEPDTSNSTSAKALYYMGKVLVALGDKEQSALARAKTYFQSVKNNYGTTDWAAKARKELEG